MVRLYIRMRAGIPWNVSIFPDSRLSVNNKYNNILSAVRSQETILCSGVEFYALFTFGFNLLILYLRTMSPCSPWIRQHMCQFIFANGGRSENWRKLLKLSFGNRSWRYQLPFLFWIKHTVVHVFSSNIPTLLPLSHCHQSW